MADEADLAQEWTERNERMREAARKAAKALHIAPSAFYCIDCGTGIPEGRRKAVDGVQTCIDCANVRSRRHG